MAKGTALKTTDETTNLLAVHTKEEILETAEAVREAMGNRGMRPQDLERVTMPAGKSKMFSLEDGETMEKAIVAAVLVDSDTRIYFDKPFGGETTPPACFSTDGITGIGDPGGPCETCPKNQWGTREDAQGNPTRGKACSERRLLVLFCLQPPNALPLVLSAPPTSLDALRRDFFRAAGKGHRVSKSLWTFYLDTKTSGGYEHPIVRASWVRDLDEQELALIEHYRGAVLGMKEDLVQSEG